MFNSNIILALIIIAGISYSVTAKSLTIAAALTGGVVAYLVFAGAGFTGIAMMTTFLFWRRRLLHGSKIKKKLLR
jgi:multidrug transporter EmrE-like cation transporter